MNMNMNIYNFILLSLTIIALPKIIKIVHYCGAASCHVFLNKSNHPH